MDDARVAAFLGRVETWPGADRVEVVETHLSAVYLVGDEAWKRKKPVRFHGHDYRSLAARRESCEREVVVNRRLAPEVYLGHVPVVEGADGELAVGGVGTVVDWLVHMRRVPIERSLETGLAGGWASPEDVVAVGATLGRFYVGLPRHRVLPEERIRGLSRANRAHATALRRVGIDPGRLTDPVARFLRTQRDLVGRRGDWLVAGHGDLRPEHVIVGRPPVFIDALDVVGLRIDPLDELAYLALECEMLGAPWARPLLVTTWRQVSEDPAPDVLVAFYQVHHAALRAHLYAIRLWDHRTDATSAERDRWTERARRYLEVGAIRVDTLA